MFELKVIGYGIDNRMYVFIVMDIGQYRNMVAHIILDNGVEVEEACIGQMDIGINFNGNHTSNYLVVHIANSN